MQNRPSPDLKSVVESREEMADIGEAFMEALNDVRDHAFMKHWAPADGPSEIIVDLLNALDDETSLLLTQKDRLDKLTWQPIETAKRDEEPRLLLMRDGQTVIGFWSNWNSYWTNGRSDRMSDHVMIGNPTRWMPLPEPPALTGSHT